MTVGRHRARSEAHPALAIVAILWLLLGVVVLAGCGAAASGSSGAPPVSATAPSNGSTAAPAPTRPAVDPASGLATIAAADLPSEASRVLAAMAAGGPFTYSQDGTVFSNREGILPNQASGYYHEYTVPTPGSSDRGARRIVTGGAGEAYYTANHYATFLRIWP